MNFMPNATSCFGQLDRLSDVCWRFQEMKVQPGAFDRNVPFVVDVSGPV